MLILLGALALLLTLTVITQRWIFPVHGHSSLPLVAGDQPTVLTGIFILDPNHAPADSLELLPGIGPVLAARIVAYRTSQPFDSLNDLTGVNGINDKLLEKISPYLRIQE